MKSALAIGGVGALSTAVGLYGASDEAVAVSDGESAPVTNAERNNRQHAWDDFLVPDDAGIAPPRHHLILLLDYQKGGEPTAEDRREVEGALHQLERAFEWSNEGLLFTVGYSPTYFKRFPDSLPTGVDLRNNQEFIDAMTVGEEEPTPEPYEVALHLGSNNPIHLLLAEESLWGFPGLDREGVSDPVKRILDLSEHDFTGIFHKPTTFPARRTGFVGGGLPKQEIGENVDSDTAENIHEDAPLSMGFKSGFADNLPHEDDITMVEDQTLAGNFEEPGVYAQGSIEQVSKLDLDLNSWYDQSKDERTARMFSPHHVGEVGDVGEALGETAGTDELELRDYDAAEDVARHTQKDAEEKGVVGHEQKLARARFDLSLREKGAETDDTLDTAILRRDFDTTDQGRPGLHFVALMRFAGYLIYVRKAMNNVGFDGEELIPEEPGEKPGMRISHDEVDLDRANDGFLDFVEAKRRGLFVVPPLSIRALPPARATHPSMEVRERTIAPESDDAISVVVERTDDFDPKDLDPSTVRFGDSAVVNRGGGAKPVGGGRPVNGDSIEEGDLLLRFRAADAGFDGDSDRARLFGKTTDLAPVFCTESVDIRA